MGVFVWGVLLAIAFFSFCLSFVGFIIILVSEEKLRRCRKDDTVPSKFGIVAGSAMLVPAGIVSGLVLFLIFSTALKNIRCLKYDNFAEKWRNEWILPSEAKEDVMKEFLMAADNGDKEEIISMFTQNIQKDEKLSTQVDEFLKDYPGGLYGLEYKDNGYDRDDKIFDMSTEVVKDGTTYYLDFGGRNYSSENKEDIGLEYFFVKSERGEVLELDVKEGEKPDIEKSKYIATEINVDGDFIVKRIGNSLYKYYETDRKLTESDVVEAVKISSTVSELEENLGKPNSNDVRHGDLIYEVEPENGEPRYAVMGYTINDRLWGHVIIKNEKGDYNEHIYER